MKVSHLLSVKNITLFSLGSSSSIALILLIGSGLGASGALPIGTVGVSCLAGGSTAIFISDVLLSLWLCLSQRKIKKKKIIEIDQRKISAPPENPVKYGETHGVGKKTRASSSFEEEPVEEAASVSEEIEEGEELQESQEEAIGALTLQSLPADILYMIFYWLNPVDRVQAKLTCQDFNVFLKSNFFRRVLSKELTERARELNRVPQAGDINENRLNALYMQYKLLRRDPAGEDIDLSSFSSTQHRRAHRHALKFYAKRGEYEEAAAIVRSYLPDYFTDGSVERQPGEPEVNDDLLRISINLLCYIVQQAVKRGDREDAIALFNEIKKYLGYMSTLSNRRYNKIVIEILRRLVKTECLLGRITLSSALAKKIGYLSIAVIKGIVRQQGVSTAERFLQEQKSRLKARFKFRELEHLKILEIRNYIYRKHPNDELKEIIQHSLKKQKKHIKKNLATTKLRFCYLSAEAYFLLNETKKVSKFIKKIENGLEKWTNTEDHHDKKLKPEILNCIKKLVKYHFFINAYNILKISMDVIITRFIPIQRKGLYLISKGYLKNEKIVEALALSHELDPYYRARLLINLADKQIEGLPQEESLSANDPALQ